jgi:glycosyltransferase involved in cell wall biosynthesis
MDLRKKTTDPGVSIGLPVYNGENYLKESLDSLLNQTYTGFEIIICDNASTDATKDICLEYASHDSRIKYYRNRYNIGAAANFNATFNLSRGEYFKWAAHDDFCSPDFLKKCVNILDRNESVVLAYSKVMIVNELSKPIYAYIEKLPTDSHDVEIRFGALLGAHPCYMVFGLIRRNALIRTRQIMGAYNHGDGVLLERLALQGRFVEIPEYLFYHRVHQQQSMQMVNDRLSYSVWFNPHYKDKISFPWSRVTYERIRSLLMYRLKKKERIECSRRLYWNIKSIYKVLFHEWKQGLKLSVRGYPSS